MKRFLILAFLLAAQPAFANHPGERIDEVMTEQEPAFEVADHPSTPNLGVEKSGGDVLRLGDLHDQIIVLSFVPRNCNSPCAKQQAALAGVQEQVNVSPMKEMVTFVTVHDTDTSIEAPWDDANWRLVIPSNDETTAAAADRFAALSSRGQELPMAYVIDRNGRHAGLFHGAEFQKTNMTLYINGLINNAHAPKPPAKEEWWEWLTGWF
ncbi:redoxin domain-containing protein [Mesorhizobium sp. Z1-4]|uniref:redoxin domain-containing protein n=1 Tax=Mesorhizobium sp. Z1-4 TaxID=2448478 RepID=UPI000FDC1187|nr:redoxin domain-containing protein [Mesorhizobium sp. Z1-4]